MAKYTPEFKKQVEQAYLNSNDSLAAIAAHFSIGQRTVEGWASDGGWDALRKTQKVVPIGEARAKTQNAKPQSVNRPSPTPEDYPPIRSRRRAGQIDELEVVESAIVNLDLLLGGMCGMSSDDRVIDTRGIGGVAGALCKLIELRLKLKPRTAAEVAEMAIALGVRPNEFMQALAEAWKLRA
jgi:transposase-like protein